MAELTSRGARLVYDDLGEGEPAFLCLPGWCEPRTVFRRVAPLLAHGNRVIVLDWPGQGDSKSFREDFNAADWIEDALAVVKQSGANDIVPVAISHAGRVAIELRRALGERVVKLVLSDWNFILDPPPAYRRALEAFRHRDQWSEALEGLFTTWIAGSEDQELIAHVRTEMAAHGFEDWSRALREIGAAYDTYGNPLTHLASLDPPVPAIHLYTQPRTREYADGQESFARKHPWFRPHLMTAVSHFPTIEAPEETVSAIRDFIERD